MLTKEDIMPYIYDPNRIQHTILNIIRDANNGNIDIADPTNPFTMLLEASAVSASASLTSTKNLTRTMYPNLANTKQDLYPHITDAALGNMFAIPATADIVMYVNILQLRQNGYRQDGSSYVEMTIPKYTVVNVADTDFTLLNNIVIKLYDNDSVFIEQQTSVEDIAVNDLGVLNYVITTDTEGSSWILFETTLKQITRVSINDTISAGQIFTKTLTTTNQFYHASLSYKNAFTNGEYETIKVAYDDRYIDPYTPTTYIKILDDGITFTIPDVYLNESNISGNVRLTAYETKGKVFLPINNYTVSDFTITLGDTGTSLSTAVSANIAMLANSRYMVDGGANTLTTEQLKKYIIDNTVGVTNSPISLNALRRKAEFNGFEIFKALDIITSRLFLATRNSSSVQSQLINSRADIFTNTVKVTIGNYTNNDNVYIDDDIFIIKSNTIFKEVNGIVSIVEQDELDVIYALNDFNKISYFATNKYFYSPFYYVLDKVETKVDARVYDLDNPVINSLRIIGKNTAVTQRVNIDKYGVFKTSVGYRVIITIIGNEDFNGVDKSNIRAQLSLPLYNSDEKIYYEASYDNIADSITFNIHTDNFVTQNHELLLTSGVSDISNRLVNLLVNANIHIYAVNAAITDDSKYLHNEIRNTYIDKVVFSKEVLNIMLGKPVEYIWNKIRNEYSERKYKKYTVDVPAYYDTDIYAVDPETGSIYWSVTDPDTGEVSLEKYLLHNEGDPILDENDNPTYIHTIGDIILDENNIPVIEQDFGVIRYIDIVMLEYEYKLATATPYVNYERILYDNLNNWLSVQMVDLNSETLENTKILYKSYKSALPVKVKVGNVINTIPYNVTPIVTIYVSNNSYSVDEITVLKSKIGAILHSVLDSVTISLTKIKEKIVNDIDPNILGAKVEYIDPNNELEIFSVYDETSRLTLRKELEINTNNHLIVNYKLTLNIQQI